MSVNMELSETQRLLRQGTFNMGEQILAVKLKIIYFTSMSLFLRKSHDYGCQNIDDCNPNHRISV